MGILGEKTHCVIATASGRKKGLIAIGGGGGGGAGVSAADWMELRGRKKDGLVPERDGPLHGGSEL